MNFFQLFCLVLIEKIAATALSEILKEKDDYDVEALSSYMNSTSSSNSVGKFGFEKFKSYNIPVDKSSTDFHSVKDEVLLMQYANANSYGFYKSLESDPIIFYERPGTPHMKDPLQAVCANFLGCKSSIESSAFENRDKLFFIESITEFSVFYEPGIDVPMKGKNKRSQDAKDQLRVRMMFSAATMASYHCREAMRIVADLLDRSQIQWLLKYSPVVILQNPGFLDALTDFSMFSAENAVEASVHSFYDWFKNVNALKTLSPSAILAIVRASHYDLGNEKLEILNEHRPIEGLFEYPEFVNDPFVWQMTAGTRFFRDEHIHIDALSELIQSIESESFIPQAISENIFGLYFHSENAIHSHIQGIHIVMNLKPIDQLALENPPPMAINHEQFQMNVIESHLKGLNYIFTHRAKVLVALMRKFKDLAKLKEDSKQLLGLIVTPSMYASRKALTIYEEVKKEFPENPTIVDLHRLLHDSLFCEPTEYKYFRATALIFAYFDLTSSPLKIPYRKNPVSDESKSSLYMVETLRKIINIAEEIEADGTVHYKAKAEEIAVFAKWPRLYLLQSALDFKQSKTYQIADHGEAVANTLDTILKGYMTFCTFEPIDDHFMNTIKFEFPEYYADIALAVDLNREPEMKFYTFRSKFMHLYRLFKETSENFNQTGNVLKFAFLIGFREAQIMCSIQNTFKVEMISSMINDTEFMETFTEFAYLMNRSQVRELLNSESGKILLASNRKLVHNLPTYEDFTSSHLSTFGLQAQYATMVRTLPLIPLLVSFKSDDYIFNDPLALSIRLISDYPQRWFNQDQLTMNAWKFVPFQAIAELYGHGSKIKWSIANVAMIQKYLKSSREVQAKGIESCRAILHWLIISEIRALEAFVLSNSKENEKWKHALNAAIMINHAEHASRDDLMKVCLHSLSMSADVLGKLRPDFMNVFLELIGGPLAPVRGGIFMSSRGHMDKNMRHFHFEETFVGFYAWTNRTKENVNIPVIEAEKSELIKTETFDLVESKMSGEQKIINCEDDGGQQVAETENVSENVEEKTKFVFRPGNGTLAYTNIPQYREYIEADCKARRELLFQMLLEINVALDIKDDSNLQIWKDRLDLLGFLSADGYTVSPSFNLESNLNLPLHESILLIKLKAMAGVVGAEVIPEELKPEKLATVIIQMKKREPSNGNNGQEVKSKKNKSKKK